MPDPLPCPWCNDEDMQTCLHCSGTQRYSSDWNNRRGEQAMVEEVAETALVEMEKVVMRCAETVDNVMARHKKSVADAIT